MADHEFTAFGSIGTDEPRGLTRGSHGFLLPDIRAWNLAVARMTGKNSEPRGSVEDYVLDGGDGSCGHCGEDLIRKTIGRLHSIGLYFQRGMIVCPSISIDRDSTLPEGHPLDYWVDVWPNALPILEEGSFKATEGLSEKELHEGLFRLSDPTIRKCYTGRSIYHHRCQEGARLIKYGSVPFKVLDTMPPETFEFSQFPEPDYVHD